MSKKKSAIIKVFGRVKALAEVKMVFGCDHFVYFIE